MIEAGVETRRSAFAFWLRTGRLPSVHRADGLEVKFNPWHDPEDGRFTFAGSGRHYGRSGNNGSAGGSAGKREGTGASEPPGRPKRLSPSISQRPPRAKAAPGNDSSTGGAWKPAKPVHQQPRRDWTGGGFAGGGGGDFGGGGASGDWGDERAKPAASTRAPSSPVGTIDQDAPSSPSPHQTDEKLRVVVRNGYTYHIDARDRTRRVSGELTLTDKPVRSRKSQAQAGGLERTKGDDGGHYVAARFNGPTEAFNHFAQNANFNRGSYRLLEDQLARAKRAGSRVTVRISPYFKGRSIRPSLINFWFTIDGHEQSQRFPNEPAEKIDERR